MDACSLRAVNQLHTGSGPPPPFLSDLGHELPGGEGTSSRAGGLAPLGINSRTLGSPLILLPLNFLVSEGG